MARAIIGTTVIERFSRGRFMAHVSATGIKLTERDFQSRRVQTPAGFIFSPTPTLPVLMSTQETRTNPGIPFSNGLEARATAVAVVSRSPAGENAQSDAVPAGSAAQIGRAFRLRDAGRNFEALPLLPY
jgi:hypothetical protein